MKLKLAMEEFDSFDAYLYKHGIIRKLPYTETHIVGLTQHILSHGSSRWWKIFSSLSKKEYEGIEKAMALHRTRGTRDLVGIRVINTRYKLIPRFLLRLISLGILDYPTLPTRALFIIIGNKEAADGDDSEIGSTHYASASARRGDHTHTVQSWTRRQQSPEMTHSAAPRPQAKVQKQQAHGCDDGVPVAKRTDSTLLWCHRHRLLLLILFLIHFLDKLLMSFLAVPMLLILPLLLLRTLLLVPSLIMLLLRTLFPCTSPLNHRSCLKSSKNYTLGHHQALISSRS